MYKVDRKNYISSNNMINVAYDDNPLPIGYSATISAPHMHAHVLEELLPPLENLKDTNLSILDVGCGSGYLTTCFGRLVDALKSSDGGKVFGIEYVPELVELSKRNIQKEDNDLFESGTVEVLIGDGWKGVSFHRNQYLTLTFLSYQHMHHSMQFM